MLGFSLLPDVPKDMRKLSGYALGLFTLILGFGVASVSETAASAYPILAGGVGALFVTLVTGNVGEHKAKASAAKPEAPPNE